MMATMVVRIPTGKGERERRVGQGQKEREGLWEEEGGLRRRRREKKREEKERFSMITKV